MKRPWSKQEEQILARLYNEGKKVAEIAATLGRSPSSVGTKLGIMGLASRYPRLEPWDIEMVHALHAEGLSAPTIAEKLELKCTTVRYIIQRKKPEAHHG
ncbi:Transposase and inactivated derivatives, IS30 family [Edwardsiella tarda]|nr:Transposase and inactivated derivatives, IS30 family [Edwardsiella tarda]